MYLPVADFHPSKASKSGLQSRCKVCAAEQKRARRLRRKKEAPRQLWVENAINRVRRRAKADGYESDLTDTCLQRLLMIQGTACAYCLKPFEFTEEQGEDCASVDKVIPEVGYKKGNVVIACSRCNRIKSDATLTELEQITDTVKRFMAGEWESFKK